MGTIVLPWQLWALLSAAFAKVGVEKVNSDFATFVRTVVNCSRSGRTSLPPT
jgi:transporter family protein